MNCFVTLTFDFGVKGNILCPMVNYEGVHANINFLGPKFAL